MDKDERIVYIVHLDAVWTFRPMKVEEGTTNIKKVIKSISEEEDKICNILLLSVKGWGW